MRLHGGIAEEGWDHGRVRKDLVWWQDGCLLRGDWGCSVVILNLLFVSSSIHHVWWLGRMFLSGNTWLGKREGGLGLWGRLGDQGGGLGRAREFGDQGGGLGRAGRLGD